MKNTGKRLKKYTSLALAFALVSPVAIFASDKEVSESEIDLSQTKEKINPYQKSVKMSLSEDGKRINYDININKDTKNTSNLTAYIYLSDQANLENLSLEEEGQTDGTDLGKLTKIDLNDKNTIKLTADIKDKEDSDFYYDLVLVDDKDYKDHTRICGKIIKNGEKLEIQEIEPADNNLALSGEFIDFDTIFWNDTLVNNTDLPIRTDYILNVSSNQSLENQKLTLDYYELSNEGYKLSQSNVYDLGSIKGLEIAPHSLVKLSFTSKALPSSEDYKINNVSVAKENKEDKENIEASNAKENAAKEAIEKLETTNKEIETTILENEKSIDYKGYIDKKTSDDNEKVRENRGEVKTISLGKIDSKVISKEEKAKEFTEKLDLISDEITEILDENESHLPDTIMNERSKNDNLKENISKELTAKELTEKLEKTSAEIEKTLKTVISVDEYNKLLSTDKPSKEEQAQALIESLNDQTSQILEILRQVELDNELKYLDENPKELAKIEKLLDDVETFDKNTKKTIKENQAKNDDYVSSQFVIVKDDFSKDVYKKLENIVTVTLDPLEKPQVKSTKEEIINEYPSIAHYLENPELRSDLLNSLK